MTGQAKYPIPSRETLTSSIEERILSGELGEGAKLPSERVMAENYGVSRPAVREALRALVGQGLVEVHPGRGAFVRRVGAGEAAEPLEKFYRRQQVTPKDLVEARKMLECKAAYLASLRWEDGDLLAMEEALSAFDRSAGVIEKARHDIVFHMSIVQAAHNPVIETMYGSIRNLVIETMLRSLGDPTVSRVGIPFHREVFNAIQARKGDDARDAMAGHLKVAEHLYGEDLESSLHSVARRELERLFGSDVSLDNMLKEAGGESLA